MDAYIKEYFFVETMVLPPKYLNYELHKNLESMIREMYPEMYHDEGYIFNIRVDSILDDGITLHGQILLKVKFRAGLYTPEIGHVFTDKLHMSKRYQYIKVGPMFVYLKDPLPLNNIVEDGMEISLTITKINSDKVNCYGVLVEKKA